MDQEEEGVESVCRSSAMRERAEKPAGKACQRGEGLLHVACPSGTRESATVFTGSHIHEGACMPRNGTSEIAYRDASEPGGIRYQHDPPVCNLCQQDITRENFAWMYLEGRGRTSGRVEFIECKGCTRMRLSGTPLVLFLERHQL